MACSLLRGSAPSVARRGGFGGRMLARRIRHRSALGGGEAVQAAHRNDGASDTRIRQRWLNPTITVGRCDAFPQPVPRSCRSSRR